MANTGLVALLRLQPFEAGEDPNRAPGSYCGEHEARRWTPRRALQNRLPIYVVGLAFLLFSLTTLLAGELSTADVVYRVVWVGAFSLWYAGSSVVADASLTVRWAWVVGFVALQAAIVPVLGWQVLYLSVYVSIMVACLIPWRQARIAIIGWQLFVIIAALVMQEWIMVSVAILGIFLGWGTGGGIETGRLTDSLNRSRQRNAVLAVTAERERIARDLHDILGHSLTAIAIKTDLAHRLVDVDPTRAKVQLTEIEQVARQALADVRTTASGIRQIRLATEIASARSVLLAAGVQASVPTTLPPLCDSESEVLGFVVREAITNTVRHATASTVVISAGAGAGSTWVEVADDGTGVGAERGSDRGSGLAGLRARVAGIGGRLAVGRRDGGGTVVRAELPAARSAMIGVR